MSSQPRPFMTRLDAIALLAGCCLVVAGVNRLPFAWANAASIIVAGVALLGLSIAERATKP